MREPVDVGKTEMGRTEMARGFLRIGLACGLALAGTTAYAQQFSAELFAGHADSDVPRIEGRLYVADRKVRIETPDLPDSFFIVDGVVPAAYLVRPIERTFIDARQSSRLTRLFVPLDPDDPCPQWQAMAEVAGIADGGSWHCDAQGRESVDGRDTARFAMTSARGHSTGWIDAQLKFPVRIAAEDGAVLELRNIAEEAQPVDKFIIPRDFKKLDPQKLLELLKRTDIWVDPHQGQGEQR
jgi:hypothetical protein